MLLFLQPDLLAWRSELPAGRVVRASARADLGGTLARAGGDGPAEAGAEEGAGVRRVDGGRPGVRADLQVRAELEEVRRRRGRPEPQERRWAADPGVVRPGAVVRQGAEAAGLPAVGAGAVGPPPGDGHVRGGGGGVLQPEAAESAHAHGRRGGGRAGRAGPRFLTGGQPSFYFRARNVSVNMGTSKISF